MFSNFNHLGYFNPYYVSHDNQNHIFKDINEAIDFLPHHPTIDPVAVIELLNRNYILGDRTMIQGLYKTPWMAYPSETQNGWDFFEKLPGHGQEVMDQNSITKAFHDLLLAELREYIGSKKSIGILLSGGMDSRIVAGLLNELVKETGNQSHFSVTAITWGIPTSRDAVYASRIAKIYNWEWKHFEVGAEQLEHNIQLCAEKGCEYSPLHLHAMPQIKDIKGLDCIIAGSFGDSIGRGEYSSKKVKNLRSFNNLGFYRNPGGILRNDYGKWKNEIAEDVRTYHKLFPRVKEYEQNELDHQLHYMRRMLNPCMSVINDQIPLYQMFSSPSVFGFMWSIDPELRNDKIYEIMVEKYFTELIDIPWARTGLKYPFKKGQPDHYMKRHHVYGKIIRDHFLDQLDDHDVKHHLSRLNIFNMGSIEKLVTMCKSFPISTSSYYYEEKLIWLLALARFVSMHEIDTKLSPSPYHGLFKTVVDYGRTSLKQKLIPLYRSIR